MQSIGNSLYRYFPSSFVHPNEGAKIYKKHSKQNKSVNLDNIDHLAPAQYGPQFQRTTTRRAVP